MKTLDLTRTLYTVSDFVSWQKSKTLVLSPSFQRRPVWNPGAKSFLIDTILRGLPIPIIFLRDQKTDLKTLLAKREVIDGQQRIRTILSYVCPKDLNDYNEANDTFKIKRVHSKELADMGFRDLPNDLQQRILDYQFSVHVLPSSVDDREVLQVFARMNSTGVKLNDQELRNANFFGEFKTLSYNVSTEYLEHWRKWSIFTEYNIARMEEVEITSEFFIMMLKGVIAKTQNAIDNAYAEYDENLPERDELGKRFRHTMSTIETRFGDSIRLTPFHKKTLFYSLFSSIYHLAYGIGSPLTSKSKPKPVTAIQSNHMLKCADKIEKKSAPEAVIDATSLRTTHLTSRKALIEYLTNSKLK
ncbi:DUF262 domain-containing protein [Undibacterium arcticum]|uniref:DUF262 domain-containing protein n=1 Tax=Undibacterium arcticum TaxID=1762892 RepID=A0ABV7F0G0_9BURK